MPIYVVNKIADALNDQAKAVRGSKVAVIGVAYKRDVDDVRESPALDIIQLLEEKGAEVSYHDPYVKSIRLEHSRVMTGLPLTEEWLKGADCAVIVTDHTSLDWGWIVKHSKLVMDTRNVTATLNGNGNRIVRL